MERVEGAKGAPSEIVWGNTAVDGLEAKGWQRGREKGRADCCTAMAVTVRFNGVVSPMNALGQGGAFGAFGGAFGGGGWSPPYLMNKSGDLPTTIQVVLDWPTLVMLLCRLAGQLV